MNNIAYVPVRKGEMSDWYDWGNTSISREHAEQKAKADTVRYRDVMKNWPVLRIAKVEVKEIIE